MSNNSNAFRTSNETLFLVNILNTMYNDNLRQITNLTEMLNNLNNSNNQIRTLLVQLLNRGQRRNETRRQEASNIDYNTLTNGMSLSYLIGEYTIPINNERSDRQNNSANRNNNLNRNNRYNIFDGYSRSIFDSFLQPVEIYPTQSQIESATRRVRYCDIARPINTSCPISMDEFNDTDMVTVIRQCGHTFHTDNIMNWFRSNCRCPVCRYDIREYNSNAASEFFSSQRTNDSSNNIPERRENIQENTNQNLVNDFYNLSGIIDLSGNVTDSFSELILNALNRTRNTR
jgi:hypothetical protein